MKKIVIFILGIALLSGIVYFFLHNNKAPQDKEQLVLASTLELSRQYVSLRYRTNNVLINARNYEDYAAWNQEVNNLINDWNELEQASIVLEKQAGEMSAENLSFNFITPALAYDRQEISEVFDKAPAGKKISTLAKFLGVDAKKAFQILKQDQAQVEADAWNEAGDTFQVLESSATVIKDAAKITTFVGTIAMTGGTAALASGGALGQAAVLVSGADLALEVTDDGAKIALGNNNKISEIVGDVRVVTEPASSILMIATLPSNLSLGIEKLNAISFGADQLNSSIQEGKVIGIKLPAYKGDKNVDKKIQVSVLDKAEVETWLEEQGVSGEADTAAEIETILESDSELANSDSPISSEPKEEEGGNKSISDNNASLAGNWKGTLKYTPSQSEGEQELPYSLTLNSDGTVQPVDNGEAFSRWELNGNSLKLFVKQDNSAYYEFSLSGDTLTFVKLAGNNSEGDWQEDFAGEDFFGGKFYEITLKRQ